MYEPGGKSVPEELLSVSAAIRTGETAPQWSGLVPEWRLGGSNAVLVGGISAPVFTTALTDNYSFGFVLPHGWVVGSVLIPRIRWAPLDSTTGTIQWQLEYAILEIGAALGSTTTITGASTAAGLVDYVDLPAITAAVPTGSVVLCSLTRLADTYANSVGLLGFGLVSQVNAIGSNTP